MSTIETEGIFNERYIDFLKDNDIYTIGGGPRWIQNFAKICAFDIGLCAAVTVYA